MRFFSFKSLRFRLLLLVLVAVVPAWGMIAYTASEQKRMAVAEIQRNVLRLVECSAREEEQVLQGTRQILIGLANFVRSVDDRPAECSAFCANLIHQFSRYANLGAITPDGEVFCSAVPLRKPINAAHQTWFRRAVESGEFVVGEYHVGQITGKPVLVMSYPIYGSNGGLPTVVFAALSLKWLNRYVFEIESRLPDRFNIMQIDENGIVLARQPDAGQWLGRSLIDHPLFKEILAKKTGVVELRNDAGTNSIYAFAPLQSSLRTRPVYMILEIPKKMAFADADRILGRNLTLLGFVAMAAVLAAWFGTDFFIMRRLEAMVQASRRLAAGEMSARTGLDYGSSELGELAKNFDDMATALELRQAERERAETELKRSQDLFRNLSTHLQVVREEERTRIARKIHDDLGQAMTALKIDLSWLNKNLAGERGVILEKLKSMVAIIDEAIDTVHNVSQDLRPGILDDFGLAAAIEWQAEEFQKRTGIKCKPHLPSNEFKVSKEKSTHLFRIVQESLTNVIRHAAATEVEIAIVIKDGMLRMEIRDNGRGIADSAVSHPNSFGLIGIKERAHSLGGQVDIVGVPDEGTRIIVTLPI